MSVDHTQSLKRKVSRSGMEPVTVCGAAEGPITTGPNWHTSRFGDPGESVVSARRHKQFISLKRESCAYDGATFIFHITVPNQVRVFYLLFRCCCCFYTNSTEKVIPGRTQVIKSQVLKKMIGRSRRTVLHNYLETI